MPKRRSTPPAVAAALVLSSLTAAGCGEDEQPRDGTKVRTALVRPAGEGPREPIRIVRPRSSDLFSGSVGAGGRQNVTIQLDGRAAPREALELSGPCGQPECRRFVVAGAGGVWHGTLRLSLPRAARSVRLAAAYAGSDRGAALTRVGLRRPR